MILETHIDGNVLLLGLTNPPVNCLSWELRKQLHTGFTVTAADARIEAVVLYGTGKHFCAGGDLRELGTPAGSAAPRLSAEVLPAIERVLHCRPIQGDGQHTIRIEPGQKRIFAHSDFSVRLAQHLQGLFIERLQLIADANFVSPLRIV